jgi:hypothetical protein
VVLVWPELVLQLLLPFRKRLMASLTTLIRLCLGGKEEREGFRLSSRLPSVVVIRPLLAEEAVEGRGEEEGCRRFLPPQDEGGKGEAACFRKTTSIIRYCSPHT